MPSLNKQRKNTVVLQQNALKYSVKMHTYSQDALTFSNIPYDRRSVGSRVIYQLLFTARHTSTMAMKAMKAMKSLAGKKCQNFRRCGRNAKSSRAKFCLSCFKENAAVKAHSGSGNPHGNPGNASKPQGNPGNAGNSQGNPGNAGNWHPRNSR